MKIKLLLFIAVGIFGIVTGDESLRTASEANPPITLEVLPYLFFGSMLAVFFGSMLAVFFVVAIQVLREDRKYGKWALICMSACSVYFVTTGVAAVILAGHADPGNFLFLMVGLGCAVGVLGSWTLFRVRHLNNAWQ